MKKLKVTIPINEHSRAVVGDNGADNTIFIEIEDDHGHFRNFILVDRSVAEQVAEALLKVAATPSVKS